MDEQDWQTTMVDTKNDWPHQGWYVTTHTKIAVMHHLDTDTMVLMTHTTTMIFDASRGDSKPAPVSVTSDTSCKSLDVPPQPSEIAFRKPVPWPKEKGEDDV